MTRYPSLSLILSGIPGCPDNFDAVVEPEERVRCLRRAPEELMNLKEWDRLGELLCCLAFLEATAENGLIFELCADFDRAGQAMPARYPRRQIIRLLREALEADADFIARHPETLFQCMWNRCWWHDSPEAAAHYESGGGDNRAEVALKTSKPKISTLMEAWYESKLARQPGFFWLRSLRPPYVPLGSGQRQVIRDIEGYLKGLEFSPDGNSVHAWIHPPGKPGVPLIAMVFDLVSGERLSSGEPRSFARHDQAFSDDGRLLAEWNSWGPVR